VTTIAGNGSSGSADGVEDDARFYQPRGITTDGTNLYITDWDNHTIRQLALDTNTVTTIAGTAGNSGSTDGIGAAARFDSPRGITTDGTNLFIVDYWNNTIRKMVLATGAVTTLAGNPTSGRVSTDGTGADAEFNVPSGITSDGTSLFVTERGEYYSTDYSTIREIR
jgi:sugar lactone lactonase YvrE